MKIAHIITRMILGGAQENTLLTCEGLHARGHDVTLITGPSTGPEGQLTDRAHNAGYRVIEIPSLRRAINPFCDLPAYHRLKKLLTQLDPDIIHTHSAKAGILGRWAGATVRQNANRSCCTRLDKFRQSQPACNARPQIVHTIHGLAFHRYLPAWRNRFYIAIERSAAKCTDAFISVADAMTAQALAAGIGRPDQFTTIHSGLETGDFLEPPPAERLTQLRTELDIPTDALVIITVARLAELKGHQYIIDAATKLAPDHPNVIWLFVGDGHPPHQHRIPNRPRQPNRPLPPHRPGRPQAHTRTAPRLRHPGALLPPRRPGPRTPPSHASSQTGHIFRHRRRRRSRKRQHRHPHPPPRHARPNHRPTNPYHQSGLACPPRHCRPPTMPPTI